MTAGANLSYMAIVWMDGLAYDWCNMAMKMLQKIKADGK